MRPGSRLANSRGVPGRLGCFMVTRRDRRVVFLTAHHVLFGMGAAVDDVVWSVDDSAPEVRFTRLGRALAGRHGTVMQAGHETFVDCAIGELDELVDPHVSVGRGRGGAPSGVAVARPGARVRKLGAASSASEGVIADASYVEVTHVYGRARPAPEQILIKPAVPTAHASFSGEGDSGALLVDALDRAVGLLWGVTCDGHGVASPIQPVLDVLEIDLA
jgi:hypothetical protein